MVVCFGGYWWFQCVCPYFSRHPYALGEGRRPVGSMHGLMGHYQPIASAQLIDPSRCDQQKERKTRPRKSNNDQHGQIEVDEGNG